MFDAKARGWRELVYESHEANVVVPCASVRPLGPTVVIEPEAVHRLFHRPVVGFEPDAATGEEKFSGNNATSSVARTVGEVIFGIRLSEILILHQREGEDVVPNLRGQDAEQRRLQLLVAFGDVFGTGVGLDGERFLCACFDVVAPV